MITTARIKNQQDPVMVSCNESGVFQQIFGVDFEPVSFRDDGLTEEQKKEHDEVLFEFLQTLP